MEGAAGAGTPGEVRAARGHLGFPQPLTVAARTVPGACQSPSCPVPCPGGETVLGEGRGHSGGHTSVAGGAGLPAQSLRPELGLFPPHSAPEVCPTPAPAPCRRKRAKGALATVSRPWEASRRRRALSSMGGKTFLQSELSRMGGRCPKLKREPTVPEGIPAGWKATGDFDK